MNKIVLIGNICKDLELKSTPNGKSVCSFNLAVKRRFAKDVTDFIPVVCWNNQAEILCKYCGKGSRIGVSGELQTRSWTDNEGNKRSVVEVVADEVSFCGSKTEGATSAASAVNDAPEVPAYDDDYVPF